MTFHLGPISEGTLRTADLLAAFADELERHLPSKVGEPCASTNESNVQLIWLAREFTEPDDTTDETVGSELVNELQDALCEICPPYVTFGAHPFALKGAGVFGFWPDLDALNYARQHSGEIAEYDLLGPDEHVDGLVCHVSDHGNVTLYRQSGAPETRVELWSCV